MTNRVIATPMGVPNIVQPLSEQEQIEFDESLNNHIQYLASLEYRQLLAVSERKYPSLGEQLDMIYKDKLNGTNVWMDTITAIKAAHPKPNE